MRGLHILFVLLLCILTFPLQVMVVVLIAVTDGLPVVFRQKRIGRGGKPFMLYKFRSMGMQAEEKQAKLRRYNEADGPVFKMRNDPRYTRVGKFLAHTGLDELPQLYNVLRGDMALFGPRPLPVEEAAKLTAWQKKRHLLLPGIISPWILEGYHAQSFEAWMKSDIAYQKNKSFLYDMRLAAGAMRLLTKLIVQEVFTSS